MSISPSSRVRQISTHTCCSPSTATTAYIGPINSRFLFLHSCTSGLHRHPNPLVSIHPVLAPIHADVIPVIHSASAVSPHPSHTINNKHCASHPYHVVNTLYVAQCPELSFPVDSPRASTIFSVPFSPIFPPLTLLSPLLSYSHASTRRLLHPVMLPPSPTFPPPFVHDSLRYLFAGRRLHTPVTVRILCSLRISTPCILRALLTRCTFCPTKRTPSASWEL